jgi:hypothetical protein
MIAEALVTAARARLRRRIPVPPLGFLSTGSVFRLSAFDVIGWARSQCGAYLPCCSQLRSAPMTMSIAAEQPAAVTREQTASRPRGEPDQKTGNFRGRQQPLH